ncbi:MAG: sensor histidine kinase [Rhodanobacteraceae bacterium]
MLRRVPSPVVALAKAMREWDPAHPDALALDRVATGDSDVATLAHAFRNLALRLHAFVERERNFTRDASHELRTPLTIIKIAADVLADEADLDPFAQRSLTRIRRSVREIEALIETFLVLARESDTGLPEEDFLVNDVVREEVERYRDLLGGKAVELKLEEAARFALHAPPRVCAVVVGNLIRNACMDTERGTILVRIEPGGVRVVDTGPGMDIAALHQAFQPFQYGGRGGHGIGMTIVRRIADRFGWPVELDSAAGQGTTAFLRFPAAMPVDQALPQGA